MTYSLEFEAKAKKAWNKLDNPIRQAFKDVLKRRLLDPIVPKDRLHGTGKHECYKIKLRNAGFRLVYKVEHTKIILLVLSVGKRENNEVYDALLNSLK